MGRQVSACHAGQLVADMARAHGPARTATCTENGHGDGAEDAVFNADYGRLKAYVEDADGGDSACDADQN